MLVKPSTRLTAKINEALNGSECCIFRPQCILSNPTTGYKHNCMSVLSISIVQNFLDTYMDNVQVTILLQVKDYAELLANSQDLECTIILTPRANNAIRDNLDQEQIIYQARVFMTAQADLFKTINPNQFNNTILPDTAEQASAIMQYTFTLITKSMHNLRQVQINGIFNDVTVEDILHWSCTQFGITEANIVTPDNQMRYPTLIIPPMKSINNLFPFLQERYGIYSKGLGYYCVGDTMYVFPTYDPDPNTSPISGALQIINAPSNMYLGNPVYHNRVDDDIFIITNANVKVTPLNATGAENVGTSYISVNANSFLDGFLTIATDGTVARGENDITTIVTQNTKGNISSDMQNTKYTGVRVNLYPQTSLASSFQGSKLTCTWNSAIPWLIKPGHSVTYHYDDVDDEYRTKNGRVARVVYSTSTTPGGTQAMPLLIFHASLDVFMESDKQDDAQTQFVES